MNIKLLFVICLTALNGLNAATVTIFIDPPENQKISGYYLDTITESGVEVSEDIGFVKKFRKNNLIEGKQYEFWVIPYYLTNQGIKIMGEPSDHIIHTIRPKAEEKAPKKPKIRIVND